MKYKILAILNLIGFVMTLIFNGLANALPINGKTTGELSDMYPNLFVPAGITFSIWGLIYFLLLIFVVYQTVLAFSPSKNPKIVEAIGPWFIVSSLANCSWILAWHYVMPELSLLIMLLILISLIKVYLRLEHVKDKSTKADRWLVYPSFSIYLGWITVATIANVTTVLVHWGWDGGIVGEVNWTITLMLVAISMGIYFAIFRNNIPYTLVIIWALYGIYIKRMNASAIESGIIWAAQFGMFVCAFSVFYIIINSSIRKISKS